MAVGISSSVSEHMALFFLYAANSRLTSVPLLYFKCLEMLFLHCIAARTYHMRHQHWSVLSYT